MHIFALYIPQSVIAWVIIGLIAGWLAGTVSRGRGFGCIADIILGMVGAILGGWIFSKLNIRGGGLLFSIAAATVGAVIWSRSPGYFPAGETDLNRLGPALLTGKFVVTSASRSVR